MPWWIRIIEVGSCPPSQRVEPLRVEALPRDGIARANPVVLDGLPVGVVRI